jgi:hypothetical protein
MLGKIPRFIRFITASWMVGATLFAWRILDGHFTAGIDPTSMLDLFMWIIPITFGILISGNVHQPSELGFLIGAVIQWTAIGLIAWVAHVLVRRMIAVRDHLKSDPSPYH